MNYTYQAVDSVTGKVYTWSSGQTDPTGIGYPGPNSPTNILQTNRPTILQGAPAETVCRFYYGVGSAALSGTTTIEAALNHSNDLSTSRDLSFTVSPSGQKVYLAYPATVDDPRWTHYGFTFTEVAARTVQLHGVADVLMDYTLREIATLQTGTNLTFIAEFSHA